MVGVSLRRKHKLSDLIVEDVKRRIVSDRLKPGDRLPNEKDLIEQYGCAKGTVREALKGLEVEGLIVTKTGPTGGAYLTQPTVDHAARALRNFLHFQHLDGDQVYQLRILIEEELAASVVGRLTDDDFRALEDNIALCAHPPEDEEEQRTQRIAELEFHNMLAALCPNPLLAFLGRFLNDLLRDLVVLKKVYLPARAQFGEANLDYHRRLLDAYRRADEATVRRLMREHMCDAHDHLHALEGEVAKRFLLDGPPHGH